MEIERKIKEIPLFNKWGEQEAICVDLKEVLYFIRSLDSSLTASLHYDDYDEYGCDHYILVKGACADIKLKKEYGGMFCPADYLTFSLDLHYIRDINTNLTHYFKLIGDDVDEIISKNYEKKIKDLIKSNKKYLSASTELFKRIDIKNKERKC